MLAVNYDAILVVGDAEYHIQTSARVRYGHKLPIEFQDHKIEIAFHPSSEERQYSADVIILERSR